MKIVKRILLRSALICIFFALMFYMVAVTFGAFLLAYQDLIWWKQVLMHLPAVVILASIKYIIYGFEKGIKY